MTTRRSFIAGSLGALALPGGAFARSLREFRVGYQKGGLFGVAKSQGVFEARLKSLGVDSVKWVEFQFGPPLLEALGLGSVDIGVVGDTPPIFAQAAGAKVLYVAVTPAAQSALLVAEASTIRTLAEMKGRRIAFAKGSSAHNLTVQLVAKAGLSFSDITPLHLAPADAAAAFAAGKTDAWTIWDPYFAIVERRGGVRVLATDSEVKPSNSFYLANRTFAAKQPAVLQAVLEEIGKVTVWAAANRDKLAEAISGVTGVELAAQKIAVDRSVIDFGPVTEAHVAQQQEIADTFLKLGLIPKPINVRDAVWKGPSA